MATNLPVFSGLTNDVLQTLLKFLRVSLVPFHHCLRVSEHYTRTVYPVPFTLYPFFVRLLTVENLLLNSDEMELMKHTEI